MRRYLFKVHHWYQRHQSQNCSWYQRHRRKIFPPVWLVLLIPVANLPPVSKKSAANLPPVSLTLVANCCWYQRQQRQICHRCCLHRWQTMEEIIKLLTTLNELEKKLSICNSTTQRCSKEIIKIFLIEDFFHLPQVSLTPVANLVLWISPRIFEKFETALIV